MPTAVHFPLQRGRSPQPLSLVSGGVRPGPRGGVLPVRVAGPRGFLSWSPGTYSVLRMLSEAHSGHRARFRGAGLVFPGAAPRGVRSRPGPGDRSAPFQREESGTSGATRTGLSVTRVSITGSAERRALQSSVPNARACCAGSRRHSSPHGNPGFSMLGKYCINIYFLNFLLFGFLIMSSIFRVLKWTQQFTF